MSLNQRDKRALMILGGVLLIGGPIYIYSTSTPPAAKTISASSVSSVDTVPAAEKRLTKLRQIAAAVPGRQQALDKVKAELAEREKGLIAADTAQQAQAQLIQIMRRLMHAQAPPIEMRNSEIGPIGPLDSSYGEVTVSLSFECRIEQLVQMLADLANQKELIATSEIRVGNANPKEKVMPVRLTVTGVVKRDLIPEKKAGSSL